MSGTRFLAPNYCNENGSKSIEHRLIVEKPLRGLSVKKTIVSAVALLTLAACGQHTEEEAVVEQPKVLVSGIDAAGMDLMFAQEMTSLPI